MSMKLGSKILRPIRAVYPAPYLSENVNETFEGINSSGEIVNSSSYLRVMSGGRWGGGLEDKVLPNCQLVRKGETQ